ncbi:MAG: ADP-ribosylglycohydrolase family protein [Planctomycetota bacterium]
MKAGWIGQMAGVGWGAPTEFKFRGVIIPEERIPNWKPNMVNQFNQDDIYVEMTFLQTLEDYGLDVSIRQAGLDFAASEYRLWHANVAGRKNLRRGIAPPDSGHPELNKCADDIDYQIEADYSGLIAPGMPQIPVELGEKFGRLMNYGDGVYAGQFVGALYAEAFFETDIVKVVHGGLKSIPEKSQYAEMVRDLLAWYEEEPDDWQATWRRIEEKYHANPEYAHRKCSGHGGANHFSIDAKLNRAYILMGLLYGKGDIDRTIVIAMRCAQDSDCNPSNAAGVLCTTLGVSKLPEKFTSALNMRGKFSHTRYDFPGLVAVSKKLVRQAVARCGGRVDNDVTGEEVLVIPVKAVVPSELMQVRSPGPVANSRYTAEEKTAAAVGREWGEEDPIYITDWEILGPFQEVSAEGRAAFDSVLAAEVDGRRWSPLGWYKRSMRVTRFDLEEQLGESSKCSAFVRTTIDSPAAQTVNLEMWCDDHVIARLNGEIVGSAGMKAKSVVARLKKGRNDLVLKLIEAGGGWFFWCRMTDEDGKAVVRQRRYRGRKCPADKITVGGRDVIEILDALNATRDAGATDKQLVSYSRHFDRSDSDGDGRHSRKEYVERGSFMTPQARSGIFGAADNNADGFVTRAEYLLNRIITDEAKGIVQRTDADRNGRIVRTEFVDGSPLRDRRLAAAVFDALDTSGDGTITTPEYLRIWGGWARPNYKAQEAALAARLEELRERD